MLSQQKLTPITIMTAPLPRASQTYETYCELREEFKSNLKLLKAFFEKCKQMIAEESKPAEPEAEEDYYLQEVIYPEAHYFELKPVLIKKPSDAPQGEAAYALWSRHDQEWGLTFLTPSQTEKNVLNSLVFSSDTQQLMIADTAQRQQIFNLIKRVHEPKHPFFIIFEDFFNTHYLAVKNYTYIDQKKLSQLKQINAMLAALIKLQNIAVKYQNSQSSFYQAICFIWGNALMVAQHITRHPAISLNLPTSERLVDLLNATGELLENPNEQNMLKIDEQIKEIENFVIRIKKHLTEPHVGKNFTLHLWCEGLKASLQLLFGLILAAASIFLVLSFLPLLGVAAVIAATPPAYLGADLVARGLTKLSETFKMKPQPRFLNQEELDYIASFNQLIGRGSNQKHSSLLGVITLFKNIKAQIKAENVNSLPANQGFSIPSY